MKYKIYNFLVNRNSGIKYRYHKLHDGSVGLLKVISWANLRFLNFAYYICFCRFLGNVPEIDVYEEKRLDIKKSESKAYSESSLFLSADDFVRKLKDYDNISFDIFDTLIFRPVSLPVDVFYFTGQELGTMDFKNIRIRAEWDARVKCNKEKGHMEVSLCDIWRNLEEDTGISAETGMESEIRIEKSLCYANPFMLEVWKRLKALGKKIIIVSDMYLPKDCIEDILHKAGYTGYEKLYLSNEYGKNKAGGCLYHEVIKDLYGTDTAATIPHIVEKRISENPKKKFRPGNDLHKKARQNPNGFFVVHIGDNPHSDKDMAQKNGIDVLTYQNANVNLLLYRAMDMSYMVGSAYRALVSNHLYNGLYKFSLDYEYGFIYGGLFVVGYCSFIHEYARLHDIDKILFLSRDGDTLMKVYNKMFPEDETAYVYWSRKAATKLMAEEDRHDFFRRFIYHKVNQKITIAKALHSMELDALTEELDDWKNIWLQRAAKDEEEDRIAAYSKLERENLSREAYLKKKAELDRDFSEDRIKENRKKYFIDLKPDSYLTDKNGYLLRRFIEAKWETVAKIYDSQQKAACKYYKQILEGCRNAAAVDIGWAGSGALALSHLAGKVWNIDCRITGIIAGTNTLHNAEPDASEPFLQDGRLVAYMYSSNVNRDIYKKHDVNKDYNIYWELLLSSPTPQFKGFYSGKISTEKYTVEDYACRVQTAAAFGHRSQAATVAGNCSEQLDSSHESQAAAATVSRSKQLDNTKDNVYRSQTAYAAGIYSKKPDDATAGIHESGHEDSFSGSVSAAGKYKYIPGLDITLEFGKFDANQEGIKEIQRGIQDFADQYYMHFKDFPYMLNISGRDAYAPMLVAASHNEKYLKAVGKRFDLEIGVN